MTHETPQEESLPRNVVLFAGDVGLNTYFYPQLIGNSPGAIDSSRSNRLNFAVLCVLNCRDDMLDTDIGRTEDAPRDVSFCHFCSLCVCLKPG